MKNSWQKLLLLVIFTVLCCVILNDSYISGSYASPDSGFYLREAQVLKEGGGLNYNALTGGQAAHYGSWPVGYSALIALVSMVTGTSVYLASKVLTCLVFGLILLVFYARFKENAYIPAVVLLFGQNLMYIFRFTWSEQVFLVLILMFAYLCYDLAVTKKPGWVVYAGAVVLPIGLFLTRYIGAVSVGILGLIWLVPLLFGAERFKITRKTKVLFGICVVDGLAVLGYLIGNKLSSGMFSGERVAAQEPLLENVVILLRALEQEVARLLPITLSRVAIVAVLLAILALIAFNLKKVKALTKSLLDWQKPHFYMFLCGIIYFIAIVYSRLTTHFDQFSTRLLYPTTFLVVVGLLSWLLELLPKQWLRLVQTLMLGVAIAVVVCMFPREMDSTAGYIWVAEQKQSAFQSVPSGSTVMFLDNYALFLRPDLAFQVPGGSPYKKQETLEQFMARIGQPESVYINTDGVRTAFSWVLEYHQSVKDYFKPYFEISQPVVKAN